MSTAGDDSLEREAARHREDIRVAVARRTGDPTLAEDVAQETMARVIERLRGRALEDPTKLENFMYRVAANVLRESRRQDARLSSDNETVDGAIAVSEDQFQHLARSEETRLMWRALDQIPNEGYREILVRFYLRQQDKQDICSTLEISPRQFANRLDRAKKALREQLSGTTWRHGLRSVE